MKLAFAAVFSLAMTAAAGAATAPTVWEGEVFTTLATGACVAAGNNVGDFSQTIFAPGGLPGNGASDVIAFFTPRGGAVQFQPTTGTLGTAATFNMTILGHDASSAVIPNVTLGQIFTVTPSTISSTTPAITLTGTYSNFWGIAGCDITFQGTMQKRPGTLVD